MMTETNQDQSQDRADRDEAKKPGDGAPEEGKGANHEIIVESTAARLYQLMQKDFKPFLDQFGRAYVQVPVRKGAEAKKTLPLDGQEFRALVMREFYESYKRPPARDALGTAVEMLKADAINNGSRRELSLRYDWSPEMGGQIGIDRGGSRMVCLRHQFRWLCQADRRRGAPLRKVQPARGTSRARPLGHARRPEGLCGRVRARRPSGRSLGVRGHRPGPPPRDSEIHHPSHGSERLD